MANWSEAATLDDARAPQPTNAPGAIEHRPVPRRQRSARQGRARAGAPRSLPIRDIIACRLVRSARRDPELGQWLAWFIGRALLNRVGRIVAARMADDRAEQHQEEGEGQTGQ